MFFTDQKGVVTIEILRILTGDQIVANKKMHDLQIKTGREQGKEAIYFELKVANNTNLSDVLFLGNHFKLECEGGEQYRYETIIGGISSKVGKGKSGRGGVAFLYFPDSKPKYLH